MLNFEAKRIEQAMVRKKKSGWFYTWVGWVSTHTQLLKARPQDEENEQTLLNLIKQVLRKFIPYAASVRPELGRLRNLAIQKISKAKLGTVRRKYFSSKNFYWKIVKSFRKSYENYRCYKPTRSSKLLFYTAYICLELDDQENGTCQENFQAISKTFSLHNESISYKSVSDVEEHIFTGEIFSYLIHITFRAYIFGNTSL